MPAKNNNNSIKAWQDNTNMTTNKQIRHTQRKFLLQNLKQIRYDSMVNKTIPLAGCRSRVCMQTSTASAGWWSAAQARHGIGRRRRRGIGLRRECWCRTGRRCGNCRATSACRPASGEGSRRLNSVRPSWRDSSWTKYRHTSTEHSGIYVWNIWIAKRSVQAATLLAVVVYFQSLR